MNAFTLDPQPGVPQIKDMPEADVLRVVDEQYQVFKEMEKRFLSKCHESWMADDANVYSCDMLMTDVCNHLMKLRHHFDTFLGQDDFIMSAAMIRMMIDPMLNFYARRFVNCSDLHEPPERKRSFRPEIWQPETHLLLSQSRVGKRVQGVLPQVLQV